MSARAAPRPPLVIGWREYVGLPALGMPAIRAKIDTGARTSALHAVGQTEFRRDGVDMVAFEVPLAGRKSRHVELAVADVREIKNTSGVPERRLIVRSKLRMAKRVWTIEISLADREAMEFDLILGRTAIRGHRVLVDPRRSYLLGRPADAKTTSAGA